MSAHLGIFSMNDARRLAQRRLPRMIFNYVDGAASDEKAAHLNAERLSDLRLMPRVLRIVGARLLFPGALAAAGAPPIAKVARLVICYKEGFAGAYALNEELSHLNPL